MELLESKAAGVVGLKILITTKTHHYSICFQRNIQIPSSTFLKSCFLCQKHLSSNKDVYMYRGDQGFCSEECRSRQIFIDDLTQLEKKIISQSVHGGRCNNRNFHNHIE